MPRSSYPLNCSGQTAFTDPPFTVPPGFEEVQRPDKPPDTIHLRKNPGSLSIHYFWKRILTIPTVCDNRSKFTSGTTVESSTGVTGTLSGQMGSVSLSHTVKTSSSLGFEIPFGEDDYIYQATLFQMHAYIQYFSLVSGGTLGKLEFGLSILASELGISFDTSDCDEQDVPLEHFQIFACRKYCGNEEKRERS